MNILYALIALVGFSTVACAEGEDTVSSGADNPQLKIEEATTETLDAPDQNQLDPQKGDIATDEADMNKTEKPLNAVGPLIVTPKFDFGSGLPPETDTTINPYEPVPEPAPGFVIKIPTN